MIFFPVEGLVPCPERSAQALDDLRVGMCVRYALVALSNLARRLAPELAEELELPPPQMEDAPWSLWTQRSLFNLSWMEKHAAALAREYAYRFDLPLPYEDKLLAATEIGFTACWSSIRRTPLPADRQDARAMLSALWLTDTPRWSKRQPPSWLPRSLGSA